MKGVLDPPVFVANITVKEQEGETGTSPPRGKSANRLLFRDVAEFSNFGHTIKSHDHQTTCSAVFEMTTDFFFKIFFSGTVMAINAYFCGKNLLAIIATCSYFTN